MKDMFPLCCATHPQRKTGEYGSHVISNAKSTLYQGLRSGRRSSPGTAPMSCRRCSPASFGEPFVPASRPPNWSWQTRYARHFPNFSWLPQKAILSLKSSLSGRTQKICGLSAWLREQKDGLLSIERTSEIMWKSINGPLQDLWLTRAGGVRPVGTPLYPCRRLARYANKGHQGWRLHCNHPFRAAGRADCVCVPRA